MDPTERFQQRDIIIPNKTITFPAAQICICDRTAWASRALEGSPPRHLPPCAPAPQRLAGQGAKDAGSSRKSGVGSGGSRGVVAMTVAAVGGSAV